MIELWSQSLLHQVRVRTNGEERSRAVPCLNPFFIRSAFGLQQRQDMLPEGVSIPSSSGPRSNDEEDSCSPNILSVSIPSSSGPRSNALRRLKEDA